MTLAYFSQVVEVMSSFLLEEKNMRRGQMTINAVDTVIKSERQRLVVFVQATSKITRGF